MAGTDDIAREVLKLLFEQILKASGLAADVIPKALQGLGDFSSTTMSGLLDELKKDRDLQKLLGLEGEISMTEMTDIVHRFGERSQAIQIGDADAADYEGLLKEQGVPYAKMDRKDDNCKTFVFLTKDLEKVENATRILQARRGQVTELNPKLYFNGLSPDQVHVVEGLSAVETELFRHYAREEGLLYTLIPKREGDIMVCNVSDAQKARRALLYTGWALTGANGARVREQVEYRLAGRSAMNISAEEGERELCIVSKTNSGHYVKITADDFELYKNDKKVSSVPRSDPDFYAKCIATCESLSHPVVMTAAQFQAGFTQEQLQNAPTIDLFPVVHDDVIEKDQANRLANLVSMRQGRDAASDATWGISDPSVSYSAFSAYENIIDAEELEAREHEFEHFKSAALFSQQNHTTYDVDMKEKSVDYLIAKAEEKRRQQTGDQEFGQTRSAWAFGGTRYDSSERRQ